MAKQIEHEIAYYYDTHPTLEDLMSEASLHAKLIRYLMDVLIWLLGEQAYAIHENLNFYQTPNSDEYPVAPDIAIILGVAYQDVRSWRIGTTGPAPQVVFEIASEGTWDKDLREKPDTYAAMGVHEYFAYDPTEPPLTLTRALSHRLFGWHLDAVTGKMHEMARQGVDGRLWSPSLDSWVVPSGRTLLLADPSGQQRLTQAEAEAHRAQAEAHRAQAEARRARAADRRAQAEAHRADAEARRAQAADRRAEAEAQRAKALAERLRSLGIDPNEI